jgi:diguanylate cyclase (GGDEF)-like protein
MWYEEGLNEQPSSPPEHSMSSPSRVLLVSGAASQRSADRALFEGAGLSVLEAGTLAEARAQLDHLPDLLLIDRTLPDGDGLDLLHAVKDGSEEFVPVILSGPSETAQRVEALQAGADECLARPVDGAELLARARALLRLKSTHDRVRGVQRDLERMVVSDSLTGLFNRRALIDRLNGEFARVGRYRTPMALAMIDLDGFKPINDTFGHLFGDQVLRAVGGAILRSVRTLDIPARYGGDEFVLVLPQTDAAGALRVCERILVNITALEFSPAGEPVKLTASLGIGFYPSEEVATPEDLLRAADDALYRAKRAGKNRVCAVSPVRPFSELAAASRG